MVDNVNKPKLDQLLNDIRQCKLCEHALDSGVNPVVQAHDNARLLIIGQAPGIKVHNSGIPWNDASGDRLRMWLEVDDAFFYGQSVAIVPMGFCYPGKGASGDLPPRKECAPAWHDALLKQLPNVELTLLIGQYAQQYYLPNAKKSLTETVQEYRQYLPQFLPLPHPSPRNNIWLKKNAWFERDVIPMLRQRILKLSN